MLFIGFSSTCTTLIPHKFVHKLGLPTLLCSWVDDFVTNRPQVVRIGDDTHHPYISHRAVCPVQPFKFANDTTGGPHIRQ